MIAEIRHFALVLAFTLAIAQASLPLYGAATGGVDEEHFIILGLPLLPLIEFLRTHGIVKA